MAIADVDGDGLIDYNEFVAATMHLSKLEKEELLQKVRLRHCARDKCAVCSALKACDKLVLHMKHAVKILFCEGPCFTTTASPR